ncbi:UNVERIFIED_CONTAM: hypothetical protein RMT77_013060 [Armadillidium vulgare]
MKRKKFIEVFLFICFANFLIIWIALENIEFKHCWVENQINCGLDDNLSEIVILPVGEPSSHKMSFMLLEGYFNDYLSPRTLCTIESVASSSDHAVNVMLTSKTIKMTPATKKIVNNFKNVKIFNIDTKKLVENTPIYEWVLQENWKKSQWPKSHFNDVLRWLLLWKYGGIYLDTDVIVKENLMQYENFSGLESDRWVGAGVLGFVPGHPLIELCLKKLITNFDVNGWGSIGPELLTQSLIEKCGMELPSGKLNSCPDVKIFGPKAFYPIPWWEWPSYLKKDSQMTEKMMQDPEILGFHVWNSYIYNYPVLLNESSLFAAAATKYCPVVVSEVGNQL